MEFSLSGKKTSTLFKALAVSLDFDITVEQTEEKLLFSDGRHVYGEFDRDYFDEYTIDAQNRVIIDTKLFSRLLSSKYSMKIDQYRFHFPHEELYAKDFPKFCIKKFILNKEKGELGLDAKVSNDYIEKPFSFEGDFPVIKKTNTPLTTCLVFSKKNKNLISTLVGKKKRMVEMKVTFDDGITMENKSGDSANLFDVKIINNPSTFTNKYGSHDLPLIMRLPTHPTIYTAPNCPLLCINNFADYRIAMVIPVIKNEIRKA